MLNDVLKALIQNSTILVAAFLFVNRFSRWNLLRSGLRSRFLQGLAYALCGMVVILFSVEVLPGVLIDMRTPVIVTAALTGGALVGTIAALPLLVLRISLGGAGMVAGLGIIVSALCFGLLLRSVEKRLGRHGGPFFQFLAGFGSAVIYYLWILILPGGIAMRVLSETFIPLTVASVISIIAIFMIRKRESAHFQLVENLRESRDLFEEISLDANIGILVLCGDRIAYVNQTLLDKHGLELSSADMTDMKTVDVFSPEFEERLAGFASGEGGKAQGGAVQMELGVTGRKRLTMLVHARKLSYKGRPSTLFVSVDITELVHAKKLLQDRLDQLSLSLDASGAVLWKADLDKDLLLADWDLFALLHLQPDEYPSSFSAVVDQVTMAPELSTAFDEMLAGRTRGIFGEISLIGDDGESRWFNAGARVTHVSGSGRPVELTGILFETTVLKKKEMELMAKELDDIQAQKLESIGRLAGGVAHDFNNLLHIIMGYAEILKGESGGGMASELALPILDASVKGRDLVRQLLLFSRNRAPELVPLDIGQLTGSFLGLIRRILEENIDISMEMPKELPAVMGDRGQIEQMLMNLCINSRDAMPSGGSILIQGTTEVLDEDLRTVTGTLPRGEYVKLSVSDSGSGIPPERLQSVFEPFYTTKSRDKGSGLGLSTVLGIMKNHSGLVEIENRSAGGLKVSLFFPQGGESSVDTAPHHTVRGLAELPKDMTVLLAEDDPQVMNLTREGLESMGARVITASDGLQAVEAFSSHRDSIDLLVFDVVMPRMNGPDAFRKIRETFGTSVPVIFATGYAGKRMSGLDGDYDVIVKPYAVAELAARIRELTLKGE